MENKDLILTAYRVNDKKGTINIDLKAHTFGYELYRISLMLLDKIINFASKEEVDNESIKAFFKQMGEDYINFYKK